MTTSGKRPFIFGSAKITVFDDFDADSFPTRRQGGADVKDQKDISRHMRMATLQLNAETGDATATGDDGIVTVFGRDPYDLTVEFYRSRVTTGVLAALGLVGAVSDLRDSVKYYEVELSEERSGAPNAVVNILSSQIMIIDANSRATDASTMSLTWPVIGSVGLIVE